MIHQGGTNPRFLERQRPGFTLVEILLALFVIGLIAGVFVLNLGSLRKGTEMQEGAIRMETAIRLARADAANTGKRLRFTFDADTGMLRVLWEADPINKPGEFSDYTAASWPAMLPASLVRVNRCTITSAASTGLPVETDAESELATTDASAPATSSTDAWTESRQALTFYPDGSSDSAVIELAHPDTATGDNGTGDRTVIEVDGINGTVSTRTMTADEDASDSDTTQAPAPTSAGNEQS